MAPGENGTGTGKLTFRPMKQNTTHRLAFFLVLLLILFLVSGCSTETPAPDAAVTATASATAAPDGTSAPPAPDATSAPSDDGSQEAPADDGSEEAPADDGSEEAPADDGSGTAPDDVVEAVAARTAVPTPTPGIIDQEIDDLTSSLGLAGKSFLGLTVDDWFNLAFSALIVVAGYFLGYKLLVWFMKWIAQRASRQLDEGTLKKLAPDVKLLLLVIFSRFAILRLDFLSEELRTLFDDIFFVLGLVLISIIVSRLISLYLHRYQAAHDKKGGQDELNPALNAVERISDLVVLIIAASFGLSHFGIGASSLTIALLVSGAVIYMGTKDIISDVVAGFIILLDQPFRVGDAILIKQLDTWGTVLEIGTRTTRIHTGDNREVIIPNSDINESQVINYTYPDSRYRVSTEIGVAYGSDLEHMRSVIKKAVRGVDGVLPDKPVQVFFLKFGDSTRLVRVQWWIESYKYQNSVLDEVNAALETALDEAGIDMPFNTYDLNVKMKNEGTDQAVRDTDTDSQDESNKGET